MRPFGEPMGTQRGPESTKIHKKEQLESTPLNNYEHVLKIDSLEPQKVGFRSRGVSIFMNSTNLQKVT